MSKKDVKDNDDLEYSHDPLERAVMYLIHHDRFYAEMIMNMTRHFTTEVPTLGVNVTDAVNLYVNPYFWNSLEVLEQVAILQHECLHVLDNHFVRFRDLEPNMFSDEKKSVVDKFQDLANANTLNQAADYAINQMISPKWMPTKLKCFDKKGNLRVQPDTMLDKNGNEVKNPNAGKPLEGRPLLIEDLKKAYPKVKEGSTMEYYYDFIKQNFPKQQINIQMPSSGSGQGDGQQQSQGGGQGQGDQNKNGDGQGQGQGDGDGDQQKPMQQGNAPNGGMCIDDHSLWAEGEQDPEVSTERVKDLVNKAVENCGGREAGRIPGHILEKIEALNYRPKDWKSDVQRFVARTAEIFVEPSRKVRNRRYRDYPHIPGKKTFPKLHLACAFDSSASVRGEELSQFFAEIGNIFKLDIKITVMECDMVLHDVWEFDPKREPAIKGRGGTSFIPVFEKCKELEIDGLIYFTDGCNGNETIKKPKFPVLWALLPGYDVSYKWGSKTVVEVKKKHR